MKKRTLFFAVACAAAALLFISSGPSLSKFNLGRVSAVKNKVKLLKDKRDAYEDSVNHDPFISSVTVSQSLISTGASTALACFASDRDDDPLSYAWSAANGAVSGAGSQVSWIAPASTGAYPLSVTVSDGRGGSDGETVTIGVVKANDPPVIVSLLPSPPIVSTGGVSAIACAASDPDGDPLSYSWSAASGTISGAGAGVNWIAPASTGAYTVAVSVSDGRGGSVQAAVNVTVLKGNLPPVIASLTTSASLISTGNVAALTCAASDPDDDPLDYAWNAASGTISGTGPQVNWVSPGSSATYTLGVTVSDGKGGSDQEAINIVVTKGNTPTVIQSVTASPVLISTGEATVVTCLATDEDGDPLSYAWSAASGSVSGSGNTAVWTAPGSSGSYTVGVTVADGHGGSVQGEGNVNVYRDNNPPTVDSVVPLPAVISINAQSELTCYATDIDGHTLSYAWSAASGTVSSPGNTSTAAWTAPAATGTYTVNVTVTDGNGGSAQGSASVGVFYWENYNTSNSGIAANHIRSMAVDAFGDIWFGTYENGVSKLSGVDWTSYTTADGLGGNFMVTLTVSPVGYKWFATWGGGLTRYDGNSWTVYNTANSAMLDNQLRSIAAGPGGEIWLGAGNGGITYGALRFDGTNCNSYTTLNSGLPNDTVLAIAVDSVGNKWFGTNGGGVARSTGTAWTVYNASNSGLPGNVVRAVAIDGSGVKWFGTTAGVARFDGGNWTVYDTSNSGLVHNTVNAIAAGGDGYKWFATDGGVSRFDGWEWVNYTSANSGLTDNKVLAILLAQGKQWFGTFSGGVSIRAGD